MTTPARTHTPPWPVLGRETDVLCARVYLAESRRRGKQPFAYLLLQWAANARRRASALPRPCQQMNLFTELSLMEQPQ